MHILFATIKNNIRSLQLKVKLKVIMEESFTSKGFILGLGIISKDLINIMRDRIVFIINV